MKVTIDVTQKDIDVWNKYCYDRKYAMSDFFYLNPVCLAVSRKLKTSVFTGYGLIGSDYRGCLKAQELPLKAELFLVEARITFRPVFLVPFSFDLEVSV